MARNQPEFPKPDRSPPVKDRPREEKLDKQIEDSFPASDPPSYAGGPHRSGAPKPHKPKSNNRKTR